MSYGRNILKKTPVEMMILYLVEEVRTLWTGRFYDSELETKIVGLFSTREKAASFDKPRTQGKWSIKYDITSLEVDKLCKQSSPD